MKNIRILLGIIVCLTLVLGLAACGDNGETKKNQAEQADTNTTESVSESTETESSESSQEDTTAEVAPEEESSTTDQGNGSDIAVIYFSATGTTKGVAEKIAAAEDADIYQILAAEPYTDADLDWNDSDSRTTKEQNDKSVRPEIGSEDIDLSGYAKIYIGYPIWWGEEPRIMDTFVEKYDFGNTVMIPFCTSQGSGIGSSGRNLAENAGSGDWKDGDRLQGSISDADLKEWIDSYK